MRWSRRPTATRTCRRCAATTPRAARSRRSSSTRPTTRSARCSGRAACSPCSPSRATRWRAARSPTCSTTTARPATPARWRAPRARSSCCSGSAPTTSAGATCPALLETDYGRRLHAAQFVTEVQGGSDVGSNALPGGPGAGAPGLVPDLAARSGSARSPTPACSWSARASTAPPTGPAASACSSCRDCSTAAPNGFALRRLKYKLGTRSMATGEIEFDGALGEAIGPLGDGFRNLVGIVLDTSRVHNALAACGVMRRACVEAHAFARAPQRLRRPHPRLPRGAGDPGPDAAAHHGRRSPRPSGSSP